MSKGLLGCGAVVLALLVVAGGLFLWGTGVYNRLVGMDEGVKTAWSQVENTYQRRADLIPNLVKTVEGAADFERETLTDVIEARAKATSVQITPQDLSNPQALARYQEAQDQLSSALSRLMVVVERYPELKANQNFLQLQGELSDIENKLAAARRFFNNAVQEFNTGIQQFPAVLFAAMFGFTPQTFFDLGEQRAQLEQAPSVKF
jgi:LemA protein